MPGQNVTVFQWSAAELSGPAVPSSATPGRAAMRSALPLREVQRCAAPLQRAASARHAGSECDSLPIVRC